jgi:hypothetical protein
MNGHGVSGYRNFSDNYTPEMEFNSNAKLARFGMELSWEAIRAQGKIAWGRKR